MGLLNKNSESGNNCDYRGAFQTYLQELAISRLRVASIFVAIIFPIDGVLEYISRPESFSLTHYIRVLTVAVALAILVLTKTRFAKGLINVMIYAIGIAVAIDAEMAVVASGGLSSPFYAGHLLLLLVASLFIPISFGQIVFIVALVWSIYIGPPLAFQIPYDSQQAMTNIYFLFAGSIIAILAAYSTAMLREREFYNRQRLESEKKRSEELLLNILPKSIADRLKREDKGIADGFKEATVLFADVVGFTALSDGMEPGKVVELLNQVFCEFDNLAGKYELEKIKTIGDAYMVAGGVPEPRDDHTEAVADMALEMVEIINKISAPLDHDLRMRIGINTGPLVAGVIGRKKFIYDLWGDTVNVASRMESHSDNGRIQVTRAVYEKLKDEFIFEHRGPIQVKGKGQMETWFLVGRKG